MNEDIRMDTETEEPACEETEQICENLPCDELEAEEITALLDEDIAELKEEFSELHSISDISQLPNPTRYAALRDLGLTPKEAYLATSPVKKADTRSHLRTGVPHISRSPVSSMTRREWQIARALFEDMTDSDIEKLYRKVTK